MIDPAERSFRLRRLGRGAAVAALPVLCGLYVGATKFNGTFLPWRTTMVDLDVYREAGRMLLTGGDFYALPGALQFLYPPFAALLAAPLALLPAVVAQVGWTLAGALAIIAILHRWGLSGWVLSLLSAATVFLVEPVGQTLVFGQLGIFLVALVVLDLVPGPRILGRRRLLPAGVLTGLAMAVKLTPAIFLIYLLLARRFRAAVVTAVTAAVVTVLAFLAAPAASITFWSRLAHGDTGLGHSIIYYTNQSVLADVVRVFGLGTAAGVAGLALSGVVALLGAWAGMLWDRLGRIPLAVTLVGVAGLLASPVSWLHHFVWVVPLALCLLDRRLEVSATGTAPTRAALPDWCQVIGWLFIGWVVVWIFRRLPNGGDVELAWVWWQQIQASMTALIGITLLGSTVVVARRAASWFSAEDPRGVDVGVPVESRPPGPPPRGA